MSNEVKEYTNGIARQRVASICLALGWNSAHNSALEVIVFLFARQFQKEKLYHGKRQLNDQSFNISNNLYKFEMIRMKLHT